jgi:hypothetical protein
MEFVEIIYDYNTVASGLVVRVRNVSFELGAFGCKVRKGKRRYCVRQKLHIGTVSEVQVWDERQKGVRTHASSNRFSLAVNAIALSGSVLCASLLVTYPIAVSGLGCDHSFPIFL